MTDYPTSLTDDQWNLVECFFTRHKLGRPAHHSRRELLNAIIYALKAGCQWKMLPRDFPPYKTVYNYFRKWKNSGLFTWISRVLNIKTRLISGRKEKPSVLITDSQSVNGYKGKQEQKGIDGFKKVRVSLKSFPVIPRLS